MSERRPASGGGMAALAYSLRKGREAGGVLALYRRLASRNACKTCGLGMGGQAGGMVSETGRWPEVCKKSIQAQAADMAAPIPERFFADNTLEQIGALGSQGLESLGRLSFPLLAEPGATHFVRVGWDEALDRAAAGFEAAGPDSAFFYSSGRASNESAFLMQLVARAWGTANINNCSYYCHQASGVALTEAYGSSTASVTLDDLDSCDLVLLAGSNPASNHPRFITRLVEIRRRGGVVIVVNPLKEKGLLRFHVPSDPRSMLFGSTVSDIYLQPHAGEDAALFKAMLLALVKKGATDGAFIAEHSSGWDELEADLSRSDLGALVQRSGVDAADFERAVDALAVAENGVAAWAMGLTHHVNGTNSVAALANLVMARGWLGRPGAGLLPLRGHSNVQGVGSCGVAPAIKQAFASKLEEVYGVAAPTGKGLDTYASMEAAEQGRIGAAFMLGGNLFASNPDSAWASRALGRINTTVYLATKLNLGHLLGRGRTSLLLPVLARDEEQQPTTQESMFNLVRMSDGGAPAPGGEARSEVELVAELAERLLPTGRFDWSQLRSHSELRRSMAQVVPGYGQLAEIDESRKEFHVAGRGLRQGHFATDDGRAHFKVTPLPVEQQAEPGTFTLITLRSEGQFNTVVYEQEDRYRGNTRRDVVMMSSEDAGVLGLADGDPVEVYTGTGRMRVVVSLVEIRPGNLAMYYPEANQLVPRRLDPRSRTPAFKSVRAQLAPC